MPLAKCPRCDTLFDRVGRGVCAACGPAEEADYEKVKQCLRDNPELHADAISEATGVKISCVLRMVDQGLVASTDTLGKVRCGRCGSAAISASKRLCPKCLDELNIQMTQQRQKLLARARKSAGENDKLSVRKVLEARRDT